MAAELTVDMTYGTALYEAAAELNKTEQIAADADQVLAILEQEPDLRAFVDYPAISAEEKKKALQKTCEVIGTQMTALQLKRQENAEKLRQLSDEESVKPVRPRRDDREGRLGPRLLLLFPAALPELQAVERRFRRDDISSLGGAVVSSG